MLANSQVALEDVIVFHLLAILWNGVHDEHGPRACPYVLREPKARHDFRPLRQAERNAPLGIRNCGTAETMEICPNPGNIGSVDRTLQQATALPTSSPSQDHSSAFYPTMTDVQFLMDNIFALTVRRSPKRLKRSFATAELPPSLPPWHQEFYDSLLARIDRYLRGSDPSWAL